MRSQPITNNCGIISSLESSGSDDGYNLEVSSAVNTGINCDVYNNDILYRVDMNAQASVGKWYFAVCVMNDTSISLYIDGIFKETLTASIRHESTSKPVLGHYYIDGVTNLYFNGTMDGIFIINKSLSLTEIVSMNNSGVPWYALHSDRTFKNNNYSVAVTPNDGSDDGLSNYSNNILLANFITNISLVASANNTYLDTNLIYLNWTTGNDIDNDVIQYHLHVDDNADYTSLNFDNSSIANNYTNVSLSDGRYYWRVLVNDGQDNSTWSETRSFVQDTVTPLIIYNLSTKGNNTYNSYRNIFVNVSITEINPDAIVFKLYNSTGIINETMFELNDTIQNMSINWSTNIFDGLYTYNVTVNDTVNHVNFTDAWNITIDTVTPLIIYNLSTKGNNTYNSYRNIFVNVSITEINPDAIVFKLYNSTGIINETMFELNDTIQNMSINWSTDVFDGLYTYNVTVNDTVNHVNFTDAWNITIDTVTPLIIYNLSTKGNNTYNSYRNIFVNVSITEINPDAIVFKLYNSTGIINETMFELNDTIQNMSINWSTDVFDGLYTYNVTVNDTVNHVNFTDAWNITIDTVTPLIIYNLSTKGNNTYNSYRNIFVNVSITEINPDAIVFKLYNSTGIINETM